MFTARLLVYWECFAQRLVESDSETKKAATSLVGTKQILLLSPVPTCSPLASKVRIVSVGDTHDILRYGIRHFPLNVSS